MMSEEQRSYRTMPRDKRMRDEPVERLIPELAVPTIISMLITAIYSMADTYFVSQIGTAASGAVGILFSAMTMIQAVSFTIGIGSGVNISKRLGSGDRKEAGILAANGFFAGLIIGLAIAVFGIMNLHRLVMLLGSTESIAPYAEDYAKYVFAAAPFMMCSLIMNNMLRFQGLAFYSMLGIATGGVLNMLLDPILIFVLGLGTAGAGIATGLSQLVSFSILLFMTNSRRETIKIRMSDFRPDIARYSQVFYTGMPSLARQGIGAVSNVILNTIAGGYGDAAIAALSIVFRFVMFINSVVVGFGQGFQPVCSFNYGAGSYRRVKAAFWFCVKVSTVILLLLCIAAMLFSGKIIALFRRDDMQVIEIGTFALRIQLLTMPLWGFYTMSNMFSQSIGYGFRSAIISCARQGICLIPVLLIAPALFGLRGLEISQPLADVLAFILSAVLVGGILNELDLKIDSGN